MWEEETLPSSFYKARITLGIEISQECMPQEEDAKIQQIEFSDIYKGKRCHDKVGLSRNARV